MWKTYARGPRVRPVATDREAHMSFRIPHPSVASSILFYGAEQSQLGRFGAVLYKGVNPPQRVAQRLAH